MKMYLVLVYDPRPKHGWHAYSGALRTKEEAEKILNDPFLDKTDWNNKPIKYKIIDFWMPSDYISA